MRKPTTLLVVLAAGLSCQNSGGPTPAPVVTVTPDTATVDLFDTLRLSATVRDSHGNVVNDPVTWSSQDLNTVFVNAVGKVQALKRGTVTITASAGGGMGQARINVKINVIQVQLHPTGGTLYVGDTLRLRDTLITADGQLPDDSIVKWTTSDTATALVSPSGLVTAKTQGSVTISAQVDSAVAHAVFTVPEPVTMILLSVHLDTLHQDSTFFLSGVETGAAGDTLMNRAFTWTSSDTSVAKLSVDPFDATVGAYRTGRAVIRAQIGAVFDSCVVIVVP